MAKAPRAASAGAVPQEEGKLYGLPMILAVVTLGLANFMAVLDISIANVSVPNIAGGLAVSPQEGTWVITSYAVAEAISVPLTGWLAGRFGATRLFIGAVISFTFFSFMCGLSSSLGMLVVCRILQGLSGGPLMPLSQTLIQRLTPRRYLGQVMGLWAMTTIVAPIAGPFLGGTISDGLGWSWVFFINLPVGALLLALAFRYLPFKDPATLRRPMDYVGLGLLVVWVGSLQIMLDKGKELDWFNSSFIIGLLIVAIIGFISFLIWELTAEHPIVDLKIFKRRSFAAACSTMTVAYAGMFTVWVLVPLWMQTNLGYTAAWSGRVSAWGGVLALAAAPFVSRWVTKVDARALVSAGIVWVAITLFWRATYVQNVSYAQLVWPTLAMGISTPFFFIPLNTVAIAGLPPDEVASGAGLLAFSRTIGGAFAVSLATTAWDNTTSSVRAAFTGRLNDAEQSIQQIMSGGFSRAQATGQLDYLVQSQSVMVATNQIFLILGVLMLGAAAVVWIAPKPTGVMGGGGGGH
jgi:DHA2 family multidrug resistance protein